MKPFKPSELLEYRTKTAFISVPSQTSVISFFDQFASYRNFTLQDSLGKEDEIVLGECIKQAGLISADHNYLADVIPAIRDGRDSPEPMLIEGETGTGKEMVLDCLHKTSSRYTTCVKVNCAAISENLVEAELFGHTKGAFTGAAKSRDGKFKAADGGIIFLDEIGELPKHVQAKLLRVLSDGSIEPVGSDTSNERVKVKVIAASNRDLSEMVRQGTFREDLFYRFSGITIHLLPLFLRPGDLLPLLIATIRQYERETATEIKVLSDWVIYELFTHRWPGNVRELVGKAKMACRFFVDYMHTLGCQAEINRGPLTMPLPEPKFYPVSDAINAVEEVLTRFDELLPRAQQRHWQLNSRLARYTTEKRQPSPGFLSKLGSIGSMDNRAGVPTQETGGETPPEDPYSPIYELSRRQLEAVYVQGLMKRHGTTAAAAKAAGVHRDTMAKLKTKHC